MQCFARQARFALLAVGVWLAQARPAAAAISVTVGSDPTKHVLRGQIVTPEATFTGEVVIEGDTIKCVAPDCPDPPGASIFTITNAYIFPGFVDAHNHVAYNFLPKWTPPQLYTNRGQWQRSASYKVFKQPYNDLKEKGLFCEMVKYGEIKALLSGITTIQGTSPNMNCFRTLIRNAENQNELGLAASRVRTYILDIRGFDSAINWSVTKSFVVHIAEGLPSHTGSREEFNILKQKGLLRAETAIIHGTAFGTGEFQQMAQAGAKLIWSPQSNLALYGQTTDIAAALDRGVEVSLGVDWNPSGSNNIFDELRVAAQVNEDTFGSRIADADWIKMITVHPARALALEAQIGKLAANFKADITVLKSRDPNAHQSLLKTQLQDVQMVWVGGELLYANRAVIEKVKPGQCELLNVHGAAKRICVRDSKDPVAKSEQTLANIRDALRSQYPNLAPLAP